MCRMFRNFVTFGGGLLHSVLQEVERKSVTRRSLGRRNYKYSRTSLIRKLVIRIASYRIVLARWVNLSRILKNYLPSNDRLSDQVQHSVMTSKLQIRRDRKV